MNIQLDPQFTKHLNYLREFEPPYKFIRFTRNAPTNKEYNKLHDAYSNVAVKLEIALNLLYKKEEELIKYKVTNDLLNQYIYEVDNPNG